MMRKILQAIYRWRDDRKILKEYKAYLKSIRVQEAEQELAAAKTPEQPVITNEHLAKAYNLGYAQGKNEGLAIARDAATKAMKEIIWQQNKNPNSTTPTAQRTYQPSSPNPVSQRNPQPPLMSGQNVPPHI